MFKHILLPTDGSSLSHGAARNTLRFARSVSARVTTLTVSEPYHIFTLDGLMMANMEEPYRLACEKRAAHRLGVIETAAAAAELEFSGLHLFSAHPYEAILATAREQGCDLIGMASHGRSGAAALLMGSQTAKVLTHSRIPVLVWPGSPGSEAGLFKHILLPTDGSTLAEKAIAHAVKLARSISARVTGITVFEPSHVFAAEPVVMTDTEDAYRAACEQQAKRNLDVIAKAAEAAGVPFQGRHEFSVQPHDAIIGAAVESGCDLICMASHGRGGVEALLLGSQTTKVLTHSKIPVLVWR
jgi:nucleotide-binding universal stress UspA family protein